ncbi:hypothetical protein V1478_002981 [Vespula squamosa]|uniref:Uncharacterized protein n=1 Tax=Vespula squamosa TaxID=30214 RepID=A0ABD2BRD9_VESSQ
MRLRESCIKDYIERTVRDEVEIFTQDRILREDVNVGIDYESRHSHNTQYAACRLNLRSAEPTKIRSEGGKEEGSSASSLSYRSCSRDKGNSGTVRKKLRLTPLYDLLVGMLMVGGVGGGGR